MFKKIDRPIVYRANIGGTKRIMILPQILGASLRGDKRLLKRNKKNGRCHRTTTERKEIERVKGMMTRQQTGEATHWREAR